MKYDAGSVTPLVHKVLFVVLSRSNTEDTCCLSLPSPEPTQRKPVLLRLALVGRLTTEARRQRECLQTPLARCCGGPWREKSVLLSRRVVREAHFEVKSCESARFGKFTKLFGCI